MNDQALAVLRHRLNPADPEAALLWSALAEHCHVAETTFMPGDPAASAFREGKRAVFLYLAGLVSLPLTPGGT